MNGFDAVGIEHSFAIFFEKAIGARGEVYDADILRSSTNTELAVLIQDFSQYLQTRIERLQFVAGDKQSGGIQARLNSVVRSFQGISQQLQNPQNAANNHLQWEMIGNLVLCIASLLDLAERNQSA